MGKEYYTNNREVNIENVYKIDYFGLGCILYMMIFREHLIKPNQKKYTLEEINKFIKNAIDKINENKIISEELKELLINLIGDIEKRKNIEELLNNKWAFPEKKFFKNKEEKKIGDFNYSNIKKLNLYEFDEIKELNKLETIYSQDVMVFMINLNLNDNINKIKKNPNFYQHRKKFIFKKN
jgi:hypothetical protein